MPLDPQVQRYLEEQAAIGGPVTGKAPVAELRARQRSQRVMQVEDRQIPGPAGLIPVRSYRPPSAQPLPVLVWFHGGGWVVGDLDTTDSLCRVLAEWAGCLVVSVNYRHAPEHPFPAAVDDAYVATCWVATEGAAIGADRARIAVGGASAGGNLAAAVAIQAKSEGRPPLVFQYLVYPVTDGTLGLPSMEANASGYGLSRDGMSWYWDQYVPDSDRRLDPLASPLQAEDLSALPPAFIITAEYDPLCDEGEAYAVRLRQAGVAVRLKLYEGMIHGFLSNTTDFDQAKVAMMDSAAALKAAFGGGER
jgi:acetyl esterase/lipase